MTRTDPRGSTALFLYRKPDTAMVVPALELAGPPAEASHKVNANALRQGPCLMSVCGL